MSTLSTLPAPILTHVCTLHVALGPIRELGPEGETGRAGKRRIIPIIGGRVEPGSDRRRSLSGTILNLGADWQTVFTVGSAGGMAELDTRYAFETDDGALIEIVNYGYRHGPADVLARLAAGEDVDPSQYYMRTHARLETADPRYQWVNQTLFVGTGARRASSVEIGLYAVD